MSRHLIIYLIMAAFLISGCQETLKPEEELNKQKSEIKLSAGEYKAVLTRSYDDTPEDKLMFLGMAGKDSLFICVSESPIIPSAPTKSSTADALTSFHISAFMVKDEETSLIINSLKLTSSDEWKTYSPTLYWPYEYEQIHFFAWSYNLGENPIKPQFSTNNGYTVDFDYTIPHSDSLNDAEVQPNLLFAITPSQTEDSEPVELQFVHTLAAIEFKTGKIGDAEIKSSTARITNILSKGHCTISHPVSVENIEWTHTDERSEFTQTIKDGESFMIIPQDLANTVTLLITVTINDVIHEFAPVSLSKLTPKWEENKKYIYTIVKGGEVKINIDDTYKGKTIQNTGLSTTYVRAAIVGYWYTETDGTEEILSVWDINDKNAGTITWGNEWKDNWEQINGLYYYKSPLKPGDHTVPIFESYELTSTGPASGSRLNITLAVQSVEASRAKEVWPEAPVNPSAN